MATVVLIPPNPYGFVSSSIGLHSVLATLASDVASDEIAMDMLRRCGQSNLATRADIKTDMRRNALRLRRFYWSLQERRKGRFSARTLSYYVKDGVTSWHSFPDDPELSTASETLARSTNAQVLNYVPLRRITFRYDDSAFGPLIGKIKRQDRFGDAAERLAIANAATVRSGISFTVPALHDVSDAHSMFTQTHCAGVCAADIVSPANAVELLAQIGRIHAQLHSLPADGLPQDDEAACWSQSQEHAAWVAQLMPESVDRLASCVEILARTAPLPTEPVFCHGDFVCSQILTTGTNWSVVDFDLCHRGSAYRDMGIFLASLATDVRSFSKLPEKDTENALAIAKVAYLGGYCEALGRPLDDARLNWYSACAQIHYLMLLLKKDMYVPQAFAGSMRRLLETCEELA